MIDRRLARSLDCVSRALADAQDSWWIIGSAAVALHGSDPGVVADIDVITSRRDLEMLHRRLALANTPGAAKTMFRSELFGLWAEPDVDVEFMAGLTVKTDGVWQQVEPETRQAIRLDDTALFVPDKVELVSILRRFGREKDLRRAATLLGD